MPSSAETAMLLFYGLDESAPNAVRANLGSLGSDQDLSVVQSTGTDGIPAVADGNGGKAVDIFTTRTGYTSSARWLTSTVTALGSAHPARPVLPLTDPDEDFALGCRFKWAAGNTGGGANEKETIFSLQDNADNAIPLWRVGVLPDDPTTPTQARIHYSLGVVQDEPYEGSGSWSATGSPGTYYIEPDEWYRVVIRFYNHDVNEFRVKVYVVRESTGDIYTFTRILSHSSDYSAAQDAATYFVTVGRKDGTNPVQFRGIVDECWFYDSPLSDTDALSTVVGGFSVPYTPPDYRVAEHKVYASVVKEGATFPQSRALPTGGTWARYPSDVRCDRVRVRVEGWHPGRPWCLRKIESVYDTAGAWNARTSYTFRWDDLAVGLYRMPGILPAGAWEAAWDMETNLLGPRRRRGFKVRRNVATDQGDASANAFYFFRANDDSLYGLYKVGAGLYEETGSGSSSLDTGWSSQQLPVFMFLDNRAIVLSGSRRKTWRGGTGGIESLGIDAPASISAGAAIAGTLNGTYYYAATLYDPTTGDESAPVVSASVSPSTQGVRLTLPATSPDSRFTKYRIYRTTNGGSPPDLFLLDEVTVATPYDDDGSTTLSATLIGQVTDTAGTFLAYITGALPDTFSIGCVHMERAFYTAGETAPERIYVTEANEPQRFYPDFYLVCEGPVRALVGWGHRLVAFTDSTVEIFESDWIRDADGNVNVQRHVVTRSVGCVGPHAVMVIEGGLYWLDRRAVWTMRGSEPVQISPPIRDLFPYINHAISRRAVLRFNHVRRTLWLSVPHASLQTDTERFQTVLVLNLDAYMEGQIKWCPFRLEASFHGTFDDDLNGLQYGVIDHLGVFKQAETYEGDGTEGDEAFTVEDEGTDDALVSAGIQTIAGSVITPFGTPGFTSGALRGMPVLLRDRSTGLRYWYMISDNDTTSFTIVGTPNGSLAARDGYYIGAIDARVDFAEQDLGTPNEKVIRQMRFSFADLTQTDLYL